MNHSLRFFLLLLLGLLTQACGQYFYQNEKLEYEKKYSPKSIRPFCSAVQKKNLLEIAGTAPSAIPVFTNLIKNNNEFKRLTLIELSVAWALFQLNTRPDLASPTSSFQTMIKINNQIKYFQFDQSQSKTPFLHGLQFILKKYGTRHSLKSLANLLYHYLPRSIPVGNELAQFLSDHSGDLKKFDPFKQAFFKASQIIQKGESIPKLNFQKIISSMDKKKPRPHSYLFKNQSFQDIQLKCNIDIGLYKNNIFLISSKETPSGLPFSISTKNGDHVMMATSSSFSEIKPYKDSFLFQAQAATGPMVFCHIKNIKNNNEYTILSSKGRDPGQHLFHLLNFEIQNSQSLLETQEYINFPRHIFLRNPDRLIYESNKGTEEQLRSFLQLDFPIYHRRDLGRVWVHAHIQSASKRSGLLLDPRTEGTVECIQ